MPRKAFGKPSISERSACGYGWIMVNDGVPFEDADIVNIEKPIQASWWTTPISGFWRKLEKRPV
jgi:hypothetical protein